MIAIIGQSQDDILYFKNKMSLTKTEILIGNVEVYLGYISRQEAVVVATGDSNYMSGIVTALVISKYEPYLVFDIGTVASFSSSLKQGDIFIPERYYFADVDYSEAAAGQYGQIPGQGNFYLSDTILVDKAERTAYALTNRYVQRGFLLSGERFQMDSKNVKELVGKHFILEEGMVAYNTGSAGIALACSLSQTAFVSIKAVSLQMGNEDQRLNYVRKGLEVMPIIGKIIAKFIVEKLGD